MPLQNHLTKHKTTNLTNQKEKKIEVLPSIGQNCMCTDNNFVDTGHDSKNSRVCDESCFNIGIGKLFGHFLTLRKTELGMCICRRKSFKTWEKERIYFLNKKEKEKKIRQQYKERKKKKTKEEGSRN